MSRAYKPEHYWEELLAEHYDESGVAYAGLAPAFNRAMYRSLRFAVGRAAARLPTPRSVLDLGSGTGIWVDYWRERGAGVVGVDLTETAVLGLRRRLPDATFIQGDVSDPALAPPGAPFALISAMSVLLHIVDDAAYERALTNIARLLAPDGAAVLVEPVVVHAWHGPPFGPDANSKARPLAQIEAMAARAGLGVERVLPATCLLSNWVDTRSAVAFRAGSVYWAGVQRLVGRRACLGALAGGILGLADRILIRALPHGPSAKVLVLRPVSGD